MRACVAVLIVATILGGFAPCDSSCQTVPMANGPACCDATRAVMRGTCCSEGSGLRAIVSQSPETSATVVANHTTRGAMPEQNKLTAMQDVLLAPLFKMRVPFLVLRT